MKELLKIVVMLTHKRMKGGAVERLEGYAIVGDIVMRVDSTEKLLIELLARPEASCYIGVPHQWPTKAVVVDGKYIRSVGDESTKNDLLDLPNY